MSDTDGYITGTDHLTALIARAVDNSATEARVEGLVRTTADRCGSEFTVGTSDKAFLVRVVEMDEDPA